MVKLKRADEKVFIVESNWQLRGEYVSQFGICPPNQLELFNERRDIFNELVGKCKHLSDDVIALMLEDEKYLPHIMTRCLSEENQVAFVEMWPERVAEYLKTLEAHLGDNRAAYLCSAAEEVYEEIRKEDSSLPELEVRLGSQPATYSPFAALAGLL